MTVEAKEKKRAGQKAWREVNKEKSKSYIKSWRSRNSEKIKAYRKDNREKQRAYLADWRERNPEKEKNAHPEKHRARLVLNHAVARGKIRKPSICSNCEKTGIIHGHHNDYSKPLEVIWLCPQCHTDIHSPEGLIIEIPVK